jgi:hypothetical protein
MASRLLLAGEVREDYSLSMATEEKERRKDDVQRFCGLLV